MGEWGGCRSKGGGGGGRESRRSWAWLSEGVREREGILGRGWVERDKEGDRRGMFLVVEFTPEERSKRK